MNRSVVAFGLAFASMFSAHFIVGAQESPAPGATRSFYMGFSSWTHGPEPADVEKNYELIAQHGDLICFQFNDGIPWPEAYEGRPYSAKLEGEIRDKLAHRPEKSKVYLEIASINMGRNDFAGYYGEAGGMALPEPWNTYAIDDERMIQAYANFCLDVIERFKPAFVNYGLETTDLLLHKPDQWTAYVRFHEGVYQKIKAKNPTLPLGVSVPLKSPRSAESDKLREGVKLLHPCIDYLAASVYAFAFFGHADAGNPANLPGNWLSQITDLAGGKPLAIGETNWIGEDLVVDTYKINTKGTPEWQKEFVQRLLDEAQNMNALYVVWWSVADFDKLWQTVPDNVKDLAKIWRDTGLLDGNLVPRPGLAVWDEWLKRPVSRKTNLQP